MEAPNIYYDSAKHVDNYIRAVTVLGVQDKIAVSLEILAYADLAVYIDLDEEGRAKLISLAATLENDE